MFWWIFLNYFFGPFRYYFHVLLQVGLGIVDACVRAEEAIGINSKSSSRAGIIADSVKTVTSVVCATPPEQVKCSSSGIENI